MCGITAIVSDDPRDHALLESVTNLLRHRGPDGSGYLRLGQASLGHRRLAILDLSEAGHQPMTGEDGTAHLVCNGEVYNYLEQNALLRAKGHVIRSGSDSETLLHMYEEYGPDFLDHANGMFAVAVWDQKRRELTAAVDRFGKKPLYYATSDNRLAIASELKSLLLFPWVARDIDPDAVDRYLSLRHVPAPLTIFSSIRKLEPATMLTWQDGQAAVRRYWQPRPGQTGVYGSSRVDAFQDLLSDAVGLRMQSDVPLGVYLSGGVDSAAVAALMASRGAGERVSYSVGFDYAHDEKPRAERLARHLGFEFNPVTVGADDFASMPELAYHLDEPFGDLLCLPAFLLARMAKRKLTVVLTGDGADEILTGYFHQRLMVLRRRVAALAGVPGAGAGLSALLRLVPARLLNAFFDYPDTLGPREKEKLCQALAGFGNFGRFYEGVTSCFSPQDKRAACTPELFSRFGACPLAEEFAADINSGEGYGFLSRLSLLDLKHWIPFSVIYRLDKLNMAHAVETRSPFLDYRVVEAALNLPGEAKLGRTRNKEILRAVIDRLYPENLREKGKQAFYMPMIPAYRARYRLWASELLSPFSVSRRGLFRQPYIDGLFNLFDSGSMLACRQLTVLAMLEQWQRVFLDAGIPHGRAA